MAQEPEQPRRAPSDGDHEFRDLADFAPVMVWRARPDKRCDWFNKKWLEFTGRPLEQELGFAWSQNIHPDDYDRYVATFSNAFDNRESFSTEYRLRRHDGAYRWLLDNGAPYDRGGVFAGYFGCCVDVTARHEAEERQGLLIEELNHRVKNTLAVVQSLAHQSFRGDRSSAEARAFESRLQALANAHDLLTRERWRAAQLHLIVQETIGALLVDEARVEVAGPDVRLQPKAAVTMSIAIHELATNAVKYGALSGGRGRVSVRWSVEGGRLDFIWQEQGGPPVTPPTKRGFGSQMLERALAVELRGSVEMDFQPQGMICRIRCPLAETATQDAPA